MILTQSDFKKFATYKAIDFVESGIVLDLGTGSTACQAVDQIGELLRQGKLDNIVGIPTFESYPRTSLVSWDSFIRLDLTIDGVDEVDPSLNLVKGRGGDLE